MWRMTWRAICVSPYRCCKFVMCRPLIYCLDPRLSRRCRLRIGLIVVRVVAALE